MANRYKILFFLLLTAVAVIFIAGSLPNMVLQPGWPFPGENSTEDYVSTPIAAQTAPKPVSLPIAARGFLGLLMALVFIYLALNLIIKADLKRILPAAIVLVALLAVATLLPEITITRLPAVSEETLSTPIPAAPLQTSPLGSPPVELTWVVIVSLAGLIAIYVFWLIRQRSHSRPKGDQVLQEAQKAVEALETGQDFQDVIIRCYTKMNLLLQKEQGIQREQNMTAREFETALAARGVPPHPVRDLTRLFEAARYGSQPPTLQDQETGKNSLNAIIQFCQVGKEKGV
ncbi:MAG: DUF4129 domain-containing protein [Anaerolineaceae bacterium]|nr:DUF4129 domain-containing protein [Anaerolineaceae bacterium]NTV37557.1 DUF4129 domain-containing protein [Anaerolineaceae bacterium]